MWVFDLWVGIYYDVEFGSVSVRGGVFVDYVEL